MWSLKVMLFPDVCFPWDVFFAVLHPSHYYQLPFSHHRVPPNQHTQHSNTNHLLSLFHLVECPFHSTPYLVMFTLLSAHHHPIGFLCWQWQFYTPQHLFSMEDNTTRHYIYQSLSPTSLTDYTRIIFAICFLRCLFNISRLHLCLFALKTTPSDWWMLCYIFYTLCGGNFMNPTSPWIFLIIYIISFVMHVNTEHGYVSLSLHV